MPPYTFGLRGCSGILPPDDGPVLVVDEPCIRFLRAPSFSASNRCTWTDRGMTALMGAVLYCAVLCCAVARRFAFVPLCRLFGIITFDFESEMMGLAVLFPAPIPLSDLNAVPSQSHTHTGRRRHLCRCRDGRHCRSIVVSLSSQCAFGCSRSGLADYVRLSRVDAISSFVRLVVVVTTEMRPWRLLACAAICLLFWRVCVLLRSFVRSVNGSASCPRL